MRWCVGSVGKRGRRRFPTLEGLPDHRNGGAQAANRAFLGAAHRAATPRARRRYSPSVSFRMIVVADFFTSASLSSIGCCKFAEA